MRRLKAYVRGKFEDFLARKAVRLPPIRRAVAQAVSTGYIGRPRRRWRCRNVLRVRHPKLCLFRSKEIGKGESSCVDLASGCTQKVVHRGE